MRLLIVTGLFGAGESAAADMKASMERVRLKPELRFLEREG
jgi:hypothetical protein